MTLNSPFCISPRLLPAVKIGNAFVSIQFDGQTSDGRARYRFFIDVDGQSYEDNELHSGVGGGSLQSGMENLLAFLGAAAESYRYSMTYPGKGENLDLFPSWVNEWAYMNSDEISMVQLELEETPELITD